MKPEEFIGRCVDAAIRANPNFDLSQTTIDGTVFEKIMSFDIKFNAPFNFNYSDNEFNVLLSYKEEMIQITAEMVSPFCNCSATAVISKINQRAIAHWTFTEYVGNNHEVFEADMALLVLSTNDDLKLGNLICC